MFDDVEPRNQSSGNQDGHSSDSGARTIVPSGPPADRLIGSVLGEKYRILERIGQGGMSVVYKAKDELLNRTVAIKFLAGEMDPQSLARFQREGIAVGRLDDPHIIGIHELNLTPDSKPYLVMDYVDGEPLSVLMAREGRLPIERALYIVTQVAEALVHAHSRGIIHRDIKPSNIILARDVHDRDFVKLLDFGIAKLKAQDSEMQMQGLTKTGEVFGSPLYMSPEQVMGREVDVRGDIYSLGCLFYEMLSGEPPLVGENCFQTMRKHTDEKPITLSQFGLGKELTPSVESVVMRCLEKDPESRYQTVRELLQALTPASNSAPTPRVVAPNRVRVVTVPTTSHRGIAINLAAGVAIGAMATAGVLYHQYHNMPSPAVAIQSAVRAETAPSPVSVEPAKPITVQPKQRNAEVKPIEHPAQHVAKIAPVMKPAEAPQKTVEKKQTTKIATAVLPEVKPIDVHRPRVAVETSKPKPKTKHEDVAYLPPPEPKPAPARKPATPKGAKPNVGAELKKAQLQDEVDRQLSQITQEASVQNYSDAVKDLKDLLPKAATLYGVHSQKYAAILENLFTKSVSNEDYKYAEHVAAQASQIYTDLNGPDCKDMARIYSWLGLIKYKTNDVKNEERLYEKAMSICHKNHWIPPFIALRYAECEMHQKNYKKAEALFWEGLLSGVQPKDVVTRKKLFAGLSKLYKVTNRADMADELQKREQDYLKKMHSAGK